MKKTRSKIAAGILCAMLGMSTVSMAFGTMDSVDLKENIALTGLTTQESATPEATAGATTELKDEEILESSYYAYGEGCFFITLNKDSGSATKEADSVTTSNIDNPEESTNAPTDTPEATSTADETDSTDATETMLNTGIISSTALIDACVSQEEKDAVAAGANMELRVTFHNATENEIDEKDVSLMGEALDDYMASNPSFSFGNYVQITFEKKNSTTGKWETLEELNSPVEVCVDITSDYQNKNGSYCAVQLKGDTYEKLEDKDEYAQVITFSTDRSSIYGICCDEKVEEETATPIPTSKPNFWNRLTSDTICLWHWFSLAIFIAGVTWLLAINSFRIRTIFLIVVEIISILLAIMGSCKFDWPLAILFMLVMLGIYIARWVLAVKKK